MARKRQDDIQLVVGSRHLLFLFFSAAVFFSLFFFWGYTIGYGRGERAGPSEAAVLSEAPEPETRKGMLPRSLLEDPPKVEALVEPEAKPKPAAAKAAVAKNAAAKPSAAKAPAKPKAPAPKPAARKPAAKPAAKAAAGQSLHLQVAALRLDKDARALASRLRERGYAAAVRRMPGDELFRVVVGPLPSEQAAEAARKKLSNDGFEALPRRF